MDYLVISIGQAGNQINHELSKNFINNIQYSMNSHISNPKDHLNSILIDSEPKVINKFLKEKTLEKYFQKDVNFLCDSSGRGNNWALGYSKDFIETNTKNLNKKNISIQSLEMINKFLEKCDFITKFVFIHSLNGGTGSGLTCQIIENLKDQFPKFSFIDFPIIGFDSNFF